MVLAGVELVSSSSWVTVSNDSSQHVLGSVTVHSISHSRDAGSLKCQVMYSLYPDLTTHDVLDR